MLKRSAFTILEVLIAIALLGIILPALYQTVALLRDSNTHLFEHLEKAKKVTLATDTLYLDLLSSDGNLSIRKDDFTRLCIESTQNSLYALSVAKVCWVVSKKEQTLLRVEGYDYHLPLRSEERAEVDAVMENMELFDIYYKKDKILVLMQQKGKEPITFLIQGVEKAKKKKKKPKKTKKKTPRPAVPSEGNQTNPTVPPPVIKT